MMKKHPLVTLHSGALGTEPNSLEYLKTAASYEPDIIEVDVRRSRDNTAVLCHDPHIEVGGRRYVLEDHDLEELHGLKPDLVTLRDVLEHSRKEGLFLNLDLKELSAADALIYELESLKQTQNIIISGCHMEEVLYLRSRISDLRVLLNVRDEELDVEPGVYMDRVQEIVSKGSRLGCCGLNVNYLYCRPELVRYASPRSLPVMVWTIDNEQDMRTFGEMGVYSITTNRIDLLHKIVGDP